MTAYRYTLTRDVGDLLRPSGGLCWVMLNPSTADDTVDDPTIRRVIRFTRDHGFARLEVVNLFAARATNPDDLDRIDDPCGPDNPEHVTAAMRRADAVVFAWGASGGQRAETEAQWMTWRAHEVGHRPLCLGRTKHGAPRHPLYVPAAQRLVPYLEAQ